MALQDEIQIGDKFNFLTVKEIFCDSAPKKNGGMQKTWYAKCMCDCGIQKRVRLSPLKRGIIKSCGCYSKIASGKRMSEYNKSLNKYGIEHPLYHSWKSMKSRNKGFYIDRWEKYEPFYEWAINKWFDGARLTRIDSTKNYSPDNCCFKTAAEINSLIDNNTEKARQTCLDRYGVEHYSKCDEYNEKVKKTSLEKYGVDHPTKSESVKEKIKQTNLDRYGYENAYQNPDVQQRHRETMLERYGAEYTAQVPEIREKQIRTMLKKYGTLVVPCKNHKENKIRDWVEDESGKQFSSNWKILNGKEIDLYNDELKLGIEFCGLYWHTEERDKGRSYHYDKYQKCLQQDIRLITIFSDEWNFREQQVKNFLKSIIGNPKRIYARKCDIKEINRDVGKQFVNDHHIQKQHNRSSVYFGLFYEDKLVGCISLRKHHRNNKDLVLDRMCFEEDVLVVGGASRLIKQCSKYAKENNYSKIISWSDNRWSLGNVYEKTGFIMEKELKPDYSYVLLSNPKERKSKQSMTKKNMNCPDGFTESAWAKKLGYSKIWDCGKKRWVLEV